MFRVVFPRIIRSAYNCIYSIWYLSHRYCYLPLSWKSWNWVECAVGGVRQPQHTQPTKLAHNLFLVYLSISTCFGWIWDHNHEKQLCMCDTWYLLFCVNDWYVGWNPPCIPDSHPHRITSTKCRIYVSREYGPIVARNMQKLINILRINCAQSWFYLQDCTFLSFLEAERRDTP